MFIYRKELLSVDDIEQIVGKKRRSNKEERLASVKVLILLYIYFYRFLFGFATKT